MLKRPQKARKKRVETTLDRYEEFITAAKPLKQPLKKSTPQQRGNIIKLALTETGHDQIMKAITTHSSNPAQMLSAINHLVATHANQNAQNLDAALALMPSASKAMGGMSEDQQIVYIQAWTRNAEDLNEGQFDKFLQRFQEHLVLMENA